MRQSEEAAEQARQLLEAHRNAGQMLEEQVNRAEATVTADTSLLGGIRQQELMMGDSDLERLNQGASAARTLRDEIGP